VAAIRAHLAGSRDVDQEMPRWAGITSLDDHAVNIAVRCHTSTKATHEYGARCLLYRAMTSRGRQPVHFA